MALIGHLKIVCGLDDCGRSSLRQQSFSAPMHLSKPHWEEGMLVLNVVNPTAGLLAGDRVRCEVEVESGGNLLLTTPSATRAHRMQEGYAEVEQEYRVASGGFLENWPEWFIPQGGTRYRQRTTIRVEEGGKLIFFEVLAPGRVASGEAFAFAQLDWETDVFVSETLVARERYQLTPESAGIRVLRQFFPAGYYATCLIVGMDGVGAEACLELIHALHNEQVWVGVSSLVRGGWVVKMVAEESVSLRRTLGLIRGHLYEAFGRPLPRIRRAGVL